jgi:hypothetical protein
MSLHLHWHKAVGTLGANYYYECRCGHRKSRSMQNVIGPVDTEWLANKTDDLFRPDDPIEIPNSLHWLKPL